MKVNIKEKHLCFIVSQIKDNTLAAHFNIVAQIRDKIKASVIQPDSIVEISTNPQELLSIYNMMGNRPEGLVVGINANMKQDLLPQLINKIIGAILQLDSNAPVVDADGNPDMVFIMTYNLALPTEMQEGNPIPVVIFTGDRSIFDEGLEAKQVIVAIQEREITNEQWLNSQITIGRAIVSI